MSAEKFGAWEKVALDLKNLPAKSKAIREYVLNESSRTFQDGIRSEIVKAKIQPTDGAFSAQEYAEKVRTERKETTCFIGIPKGETVRGTEIGPIAIQAEFGLLGANFLGVWRKFMATFEKSFIAKLQKMNSEK